MIAKKFAVGVGIPVLLADLAIHILIGYRKFTREGKI